MKYFYGFGIGMLFEYLLRVKFEILPLILLIILVLMVIVKELETYIEKE